MHASVLDTGIRSTHSEFGGRVSLDYNAFSDSYGASDCNGHGTHVAGTLGGSTYGVAKGVSLHAIRVLNCNSSGSYAGVIAGVDWVTANHIKPAVANMSRGGSGYQALDDAITTSIAAGVTYVVAAGNDGADACSMSPARVSGALTVGATDSSDARPSWSNYGACLDLFAPGNSITSASYSSDTATTSMSGTSMASPHVAGAVALHLQLNPSDSPATVSAAVARFSTEDNLVSNAGTNSKNLLLYTGWIAGSARTINVRASTGHVFTAGSGGGGDIRADVSTAWVWERFNLIDTPPPGLQGPVPDCLRRRRRRLARHGHRDWRLGALPHLEAQWQRHPPEWGHHRSPGEHRPLRRRRGRRGRGCECQPHRDWPLGEVHPGAVRRGEGQSPGRGRLPPPSLQQVVLG